MLTKQFPKNAQRKPGHENAQNTLLSPRLVMSPSVMGSRGMFSANKRKAVDILREAIQRESAGEVESALSLCEDAILVFPDATIGNKIRQLRSKLRQQAEENACASKAKSSGAGKLHHPISSGSDIISAMLRKNIPKRADSGRHTPKKVHSPSDVMIRSIANLASKALAEKAALAAEEALPQKHFDFDEEPNNEEYHIDADPIQQQAPAAPLSVSREEVANTLKKKVSEAINYQLLDILNNGSADELLGLHLIGPKRAQYIMELREERFVFSSLDDLSMISFTPKTIRTFKELNIPLAVGYF